MSETTEKITREDTPAGMVVYREIYDDDGNLIRRDVEHLVSVILMTQCDINLTDKPKEG